MTTMARMKALSEDALAAHARCAWVFARLRAGAVFALVVLLCVSLGACATDRSRGYAVMGRPAFGVATVFVPVFNNRTLSTGTETLLTEAVMKQVQARTGMKVVSNEAVAESVLRGEVVNVEMRRMSVESTTGYVQELAVVITIDWTWTQATTGRVLASKKNFTSVDTFVPARPTGERLATGENAAVQRLAHDVVDAMRESW
jgi:hypothetical protein